MPPPFDPLPSKPCTGVLLTRILRISADHQAPKASISRITFHQKAPMSAEGARLGLLRGYIQSEGGSTTYLRIILSSPVEMSAAQHGCTEIE